MSSVGERIRVILRSMVKSEIKNSVKNSVSCTVLSVSANTTTGLMTCDCQPIDKTAVIEDVQLCANFNDNTTQAGFLLIPSVGSIVAVSFKNNSDAFVSMVSVVDAVYLNGNSFGGLVKVNDLKTQLTTLQNEINSLKTLTHTAIAVYSAAIDSNASAIAFAAATLPQISLTTIENTLVNQGDGNLI